jgi:hypothetical protein
MIWYPATPALSLLAVHLRSTWVELTAAAEVMDGTLGLWVSPVAASTVTLTTAETVPNAFEAVSL